MKNLRKIITNPQTGIVSLIMLQKYSTPKLCHRSNGHKTMLVILNLSRTLLCHEMKTYFSLIAFLNRNAVIYFDSVTASEVGGSWEDDGHR
ncbi:hypothetical protein RJT34_18257 [Clitoria ternatea]|uniref:Uncharacterized protein n=1 Tax=Clitoria ternatea TaxID=43366 RepID=A0AAN9JAF8_CLITE